MPGRSVGSKGRDSPRPKRARQTEHGILRVFQKGANRAPGESIDEASQIHLAQEQGRVAIYKVPVSLRETLLTPELSPRTQPHGRILIVARASVLLTENRQGAAIGATSSNAKLAIVTRRT